jgi:mono/diheme cytochrome c family protein
MPVRIVTGPIAVLVLVVACLVAISPERVLALADTATRQGYYTQSQAAAGQELFHETCAICHGDHLQGGAGPALAGQQFLSVSQYQQITADYFYHFMSTHMPLTHPGSLSPTQYLDIMAYFLEVNGYPAGPHELTGNDEELKGIKIEPQH